MCYEQDVFEEAKSEASRVPDVFEKPGATIDANETRWLLRRLTATPEESKSNLVIPENLTNRMATASSPKQFATCHVSTSRVRTGR